MKKIYSLLALGLVSGMSFGQSQRFVLAEEFTQASCPPCAAQNPAFNALLDANQTKIIGLKYQVWWPGFDPMYLQNKTDVNTRVAYYGVNGVPHGIVDGAAITGGGYVGAPNGLTQAEIDAEYALPSPFTIDLTHSFDPGMTQMTINADITCTQAVTGNLVANVAVMERAINFAAAPGTNGETAFYGVMKKLLPTDQGTAVTAMTNGATQNINIVYDIPWYIYNLNQLSVVVFIQDNGTKVVHQAAYSAPIGGLPAVDMQITNVTGVPTLLCAGTFSPVVTLKNNAATTLTSCNVNYQIDGGTPVATPWTGSLAQNATAQVTLMNISAANGQHSLRIYTSDLDAGADISPVNNNTFKTFSFSTTSVAPPVTEGFTAATFPPTDWIVNDVNADNVTWARVTTCGGFGLSSQCTKMDFYNSLSGRIDELFVKKLDMTSFPGSTAYLTFNVAYKQYQAENDKLEVMVSTDCGATWVTKFSKQGATLSTSPGGQTNAFTPTASQWRFESVDLSSYVGTADVLVKFKATSNYGNNLYVDDINLFSQVGIAEAQLENDIKLNPTLTTGLVNMEVAFDKAHNLNVIVYNAMGQEVMSQSYGHTVGGTFPMDFSQVANGNYTVKIMTDDAAISKTISVAK